MQENKSSEKRGGAFLRRFRNRRTLNIAIPHIGMRIIKTAVAVFICFLLDRWHGNPPLIAAFAAVICMQGSIEQTLENGKQRMWGTLLGGLFGGLALWALGQLNVPVTSVVFYLVVALLIIPLIYLTVLMEQRNAVSLAVVVFVVICFYYGQNLSPFQLAFDRTASTLLGIVIAGLVNYVLPGQKSGFIEPHE